MDVKRSRGGSARLLLDDAETDLIRRLSGEMRALITTDLDESDPVVDRLFPNAYEDIADEAAYRDLVGDSLVQEKLAALDTISIALGEVTSDVTIGPDDLGAWLATLTDMRLAIGTRLDVDEERMSQDIDPDDPDARALAVMHWLGWVQESLLRVAAT